MNSVVDKNLVAFIKEQIKSKNYLVVLKTCENANLDSDLILFFQAQVYFRLQKYDLAKKYFLKIKDISLKNNKYYFLKGLIFEKLKDIISAEHGYFMAVRKLPTNHKYLKKYMSFMRSNNLYEDAIKKIEVVADNKKGKDFLLRLEIVKFHMSNKDLKAAFTLLRELESHSNVNFDLIHSNYVLIYESIGDYESALLKMAKIHDIVPEFNLKRDEFNYLLNKSTKVNVADFYNFELRNKNKNLTIVFSPLENKFVLRGYDFNTSVLFVNEKIFSYYTYGYDDLIDYISRVIEDNSFDKINLTGSSKGSFAAINMALGLEKYFPNKKIKVIAFSPQAEIFPINNDILGLASYKWVLRSSKIYHIMQFNLQKYGSPMNRMGDSTIEINIIYGDCHSRDRKEAEKFAKFKNVELMPLNEYPFHTSVLLYTKKGALLEKALTNKAAMQTKDDIFFAQENDSILTQQIVGKINEYNFDLNEILLN